MDTTSAGWKSECMTVAAVAATCEPAAILYGCRDCRAAYCGPCAKHLREGCPRCLRPLDEVTIPRSPGEGREPEVQ